MCSGVSRLLSPACRVVGQVHRLFDFDIVRLDTLSGEEREREICRSVVATTMIADGNEK